MNCFEVYMMVANAGISLTCQRPRKENLIFDGWLASAMADAVFMYGVTAGIFAFLVAILFGSRAAHKRRGSDEGPGASESHSQTSSASGNEGRRIKKFKSDGTPVYE
jgi:F0F1-type ATP synthase membrane subunit c/vacuolar-type H+-ATPase subunit K